MMVAGLVKSWPVISFTTPIGTIPALHKLQVSKHSAHCSRSPPASGLRPGTAQAVPSLAPSVSDRPLFAVTVWLLATKRTTFVGESSNLEAQG